MTPMDYIPAINLALNLLLLPLLKLLWDVKIEIVRLNGKVEAQEWRLLQLESKLERVL